MSLYRKLAVAGGRAMVRVRYTGTQDLATIGVCPGCWNIEERRRVLLIKLKKMELEVVHKDDTLTGTYRFAKKHAPGCPYGKKQNQPWEKFKRAMKKYKNPL